MNYLFTDCFVAALIGEQLGHALLMYPVAWFMVRAKTDQSFSITKFNWHLGGYVATGIGAGAVQFLFALLVGRDAVLEPQSLLAEGIYVVGLPLLFAVGSCLFIKHNTSYYEAGEAA